MITAGIDVGTRFVKACVIDDDKILGYSIMELDFQMKKLTRKSLHLALDKTGLSSRHIKKLIATGYGGEFVSKAAYHLPEGPCVARAAQTIDPSVHTVIDAGALFIQVTSIDSNGFYQDTVTNEKCAAGSGKFLEMVAKHIQLPLESMSEVVLESTTPVFPVNNCAVFQESEIISQLNTGQKVPDIVSGLITTMASKTRTLLSKSTDAQKIALVGGMSRISAYKQKLEEMLTYTLITFPVDPQIVPAYGAALLAQGPKQTRIIRKAV